MQNKGEFIQCRLNFIVSDMPEYGYQHAIPRSYLAAWCDPVRPLGYEPFLWLGPKHPTTLRAKAPKNIFGETDLYTITDPSNPGSRNLRLELGLKTIEEKFLTVRDNYIIHRKKLPTRALIELLVFFATMHSRTIGAREHIRSQWKHALKIGDDLESKLKTMTVEQKKSMPRSLPSNGPSMTLQQVRDLVEKPLQKSLAIQTTAIAQAIMEMHMNVSILCTNDDVGFITSDNPCLFYDPRIHERPLMHQHVGLGYETVELTLPLTPHHLLFITHTKQDLYIDVSNELVAELNRRTNFCACENIVVKKNFIDPYWSYNMTKEQWLKATAKKSI